jgi:two-component system chemotaxis response regulator CheY
VESILSPTHLPSRLPRGTLIARCSLCFRTGCPSPPTDPLSPLRRSHERGCAPPVHGARRRGRRADRHLLAALLESEGFRVVTTRDGASAYALALRTRPDLLIADNLMPGLDGVTLIRRLRHVCPRLPILLTSASPVWDIPQGVAFLPKPFDLDALMAEVFRLLRPRLCIIEGQPSDALILTYRDAELLPGGPPIDRVHAATGRRLHATCMATARSGAIYLIINFVDESAPFRPVTYCQGCHAPASTDMCRISRLSAPPCVGIARGSQVAPGVAGSAEQRGGRCSTI